MTPDIEILSNIQPVVLKATLQQNIYAKIKALQQHKISSSKVYAIAASLLVLIAINLLTITTIKKATAINNIATNLTIDTDNNLYNE